MEHIKSSFYFQSNEDVWRVDYVYYTSSKWGGSYLKAIVYLNDEVYWDFVDGLPNTRTDNPTKTQAKEIISVAKKEYKEFYKLRDSRDSKISKILK